MPKVSVVMPIYNAEKFIERSVDSLISQTLEDIEIILVDDGSSDSTGQICDNYAENDKRIKVIHKENSGMGASYNEGIKAAKGEYIGFLESDDRAQENMFEDLYYLAKKQNLDIAKSAWFDYFMQNDRFEKNMQAVEYNSYDVFSIKENPYILFLQFSVWSAIYRADFLRSNNIYYLETPGASYQDVAFSYKAFGLAQRMSVTPNAYIFYTKDNENSSVNSFDKAEVIFGEYEEVDKFFEEHPYIKECANTQKLTKQYSDYIWNYNRIDSKYKSDFLQHFAAHFGKYKENEELNCEFKDNIDYNLLEFLLYSTGKVKDI